MKRLIAIVLALAAASASAVTFMPIAGDITVITSPNRRNAAITVANGEVVTAQFCATFPEPIAEPITLAEKGQVIYAPQPIEGLAPGTKINSPEPIVQSLTIVPTPVPPFAFVAKGVLPIYKGAKPIVVKSVYRQDWVGEDKKRIVPGVAECFEAQT
jgi:hypothetical protein